MILSASSEMRDAKFRSVKRTLSTYSTGQEQMAFFRMGPSVVIPYGGTGLPPPSISPYVLVLLR